MASTSSGRPYSLHEDIDRVPRKVKCQNGKELAVRNTGMNTLWISFDGIVWWDVASGTSFDIRAELEFFYAKTKIGVTSMAGIATT